MNLFIVTACRNAEATIADTFASLDEQREQWTHYFIIDGISSDATVPIAREFASTQGDSVTLLSEEDTGIYNAMNKGIRLALKLANDEDLIGIINADDYYVSQALAVMTETARAHPDIDVFYGDCELMDFRGRSTRKVAQSKSPLSRCAAEEGMPLEHPTMFVRARLYRKLGLYDETYRIAADYDFVLRLIDAGASTRYLAVPIVRFREGGISTSAIDESYQEAIRARVSHGADPHYENRRYRKQKFNEQLYALLHHIPGVEKLYNERYRSR